jgi:hypothetical protein
MLEIVPSTIFLEPTFKAQQLIEVVFEGI